MPIKFTIPVEPKPQRRDRIGVFAGHGISYKHPEQSRYESKITVLIKQYRPEKPIVGAIELRVICYLPIPKSKSKKWKEAALNGEILPTGKPDCSNLLKNCEDIMEGIFYRNDSQIVRETASKYYSDEPRWEITLEDFEK